MLETDIAPTRLIHSSASLALPSHPAAENRKYLESAQKRGAKFAPLGFETHGRFGQPVLDLLARLAGNTPDYVGFAVADMVLDLALSLVRGNALCARRTFARALRFRDLTRSAVAV